MRLSAATPHRAPNVITRIFSAFKQHCAFEMKTWRSRLLALFPIALWLFAACPLPAGTISGVVNAEGKPEAAQGAGGRYDTRKFKFVEKVNYSEMRDFVVWIEGPVPGLTNTAPSVRT